MSPAGVKIDTGASRRDGFCFFRDGDRWQLYDQEHGARGDEETFADERSALQGLTSIVQEGNVASISLKKFNESSGEKAPSVEGEDWSSLRGSSTRKVLPTPTSLVSSRLPPMASTMRRLSTNPRPTPSVFSPPCSRRSKGTKSRAWSAGETPGRCRAPRSGNGPA